MQNMITVGLWFSASSQKHKASTEPSNFQQLPQHVSTSTGLYPAVWGVTDFMQNVWGCKAIWRRHQEHVPPYLPLKEHLFRYVSLLLVVLLLASQCFLMFLVLWCSLVFASPSIHGASPSIHGIKLCSLLLALFCRRASIPSTPTTPSH